MILLHLQSLRSHGEWADARLIAALEGSAISVPSAVRELAHIRGAQETWLARIERRDATLSVWPELTIAEIARVSQTLDTAMRTLLERLQVEALSDEIAYTNTLGKRFVTPLGEILLHLFMHGQYHRGKVNAALRAAGAEPVGIDYIVWHRQSGRSPASGRFGS